MTSAASEPGRGGFPAMRALRIAAVAAAVPLVFSVSQRVGAASGNEEVPGLFWAIGVLSFIFLLRAVATEWSAGPEAVRMKDLLWGLSAGGWLTVLIRP
jgi:hypothetical protein